METLDSSLPGTSLLEAEEGTLYILGVIVSLIVQWLKKTTGTDYPGTCRVERNPTNIGDKASAQAWPLPACSSNSKPLT